MKHMLIALILFVAFIAASQPVSAQGTCVCGMSDTSACDKYADGGDAICDTGYVATCNMKNNTCGCDCLPKDSVTCGAKAQSCCEQDGKYVCNSGLTCSSAYICEGNELTPPTPVPFDMCKAAGDQEQECQTCKQGGGVLTALGCIYFNPQYFVTQFLNLATGIGGGIALLLMVYGAYMISISAGDPKKADEGKEIITGAIAGLLFIIFSIVLLKVIGVDILQIPGL